MLWSTGESYQKAHREMQPSVKETRYARSGCTQQPSQSLLYNNKQHLIYSLTLQEYCALERTEVFTVLDTQNQISRQ